MTRPEPTWRKLREHIPAQLADTEAIDSLGVGVDRYAAVPVPVLLLGGRLLSPNHLRTRLDALADVLPNLDRKVIKRTWGHGAHSARPVA
ncbi:MAG TPA: hypothetical protein VK925_07440 [Jiangellaceae bacterium]|nr:hypothetical protein [Jiangellaceae bacterium]